MRYTYSIEGDDTRYELGDKLKALMNDYPLGSIHVVKEDASRSQTFFQGFKVVVDGYTTLYNLILKLLPQDLGPFQRYEGYRDWLSSELLEKNYEQEKTDA